MVSDERQILNLLHSFCEFQDAGDLSGAADLFRHASFRVRGGPSLFGYEERLAASTAQIRFYEDGTPRTHHVTSNTILEIDEDELRATARSYFTVFQDTPDLPLRPIVAGHYHDVFEKVNHSWRFCERVVESRLVGDVSGHAKQNPF